MRLCLIFPTVGFSDSVAVLELDFADKRNLEYACKRITVKIDSKLSILTESVNTNNSLDCVAILLNRLDCIRGHINARKIKLKIV